jgi:hypothetical protein
MSQIPIISDVQISEADAEYDYKNICFLAPRTLGKNVGEL